MPLAQERALFKDIQAATAIAVASIAIGGASNAHSEIIVHNHESSNSQHTYNKPIASAASFITENTVNLEQIMPFYDLDHQPHHHKPPHHNHEHQTAQNQEITAQSKALAKWLLRLRTCESTDNYSDNTGNSYYGAYQFSLATWRSLGLRGLPSEASPALQDWAIIENTDRSSDGLASQNPGCYNSTGISAKPPKVNFRGGPIALERILTKSHT